MDKDARIAQLEAQLRRDRDQFAFYAQNHRAKPGGHEEGTDTCRKALANERMVEEIDVLLDNDQPAPITHPELVQALQKPGEDILAGFSPLKADVLHMAFGVLCEAGELGDPIKAWAFYGKELDRENVVEEMGDLEFFLQGLRRRLGVTREETLNWNIQKLSTRYAALNYSDAAAIARADKA